MAGIVTAMDVTHRRFFRVRWKAEASLDAPPYLLYREYFMTPEQIAETIRQQLAQKERDDLDQLGRAQTGGPMTDAEAFHQQIQADRVSEADGRRRDGDYLYGQIVGASYVLDKIGAPAHDGIYTLTVGQRVEAFLKTRKIVNGNDTLSPSEPTSESRP